MAASKSKSEPLSPFNWRENKEPTIFYKDPHFRAKGPTGRSGSQIMADWVEQRRADGFEPSVVNNLGSDTKEKEERMLAYRQFGTYSRAQPGKKPNKHEK